MTGLQFFNNIHAISRRGRKTELRRILHDPVGRTPRHVCIFFFQNSSSTLARLARHPSAFTSMCGTDTAGRGALEPPPEGGARTKPYSTENSSSANRILRPRQKTPDQSPCHQGMTRYSRNDFIYIYTRRIQHLHLAAKKPAHPRKGRGAGLPHVIQTKAKRPANTARSLSSRAQLI